MTVRAVEWKNPYTWGKAIEITEDKVINLRLRDENNLIIWDEWDNEIYVDLQLWDEITPTDTFPVWITTGRAIVDNWWDATGTLVCFKTTSGDNIKLFYTDSGSVFVDNGTWTFKQIYLKSEVDALLATKQNLLTAWDNITIDSNNVISSDKGIVVSNTQPSDATEWLLWYNTVTDQLKVYDWTDWNWIWWWGGGSTYTAWHWINIDVNDEISNTLPFEPTNTWTAGQVLKLDLNWDYWWDNESWWGSGDVVWPASSTDWHLALFDWTTGKLLKDWWAVPTVPTNVSSFNNDAGYITSSALPWTATTSTAWLIKIASNTVQSESAQSVTSTSGRTYWVQLDSNWEAVVNIPWTDTQAVTSVNNQTWAVTVNEVPSGWSNWQLLTWTWSWPAWMNGIMERQASLTVANWSNKEQTVNVLWVTASNVIIVSPAPANINDYASNSVYCSAQGSGTLTFKCNTVPSVDISVNILTIN